MHDLGQKTDYAARMMLPAIVTILLFIFFQLPIGLAGLAQFPPHVGFISLYYWCIFRPQTMPYWFLFLLGIFIDALSGMPLGITSLLFILFRYVLLMPRRLLARETFFAAWFGFAVLLAAILLLQWGIMGLYNATIMPTLPVVMQWLFSVGCYPLAHLLFGSLYRQIPPSGKATGWK